MSESGQEIELRDKINTYTINLNEPESFDREEFELKINSFSGPAAKWIVLGDKLIFFPFFTQHKKVFEFTPKKPGDELKTAGIFMKSQDGGNDQMLLFSFSPSLSELGLLSKNNSDQYKNETLIHKLKEMDPCFEIGT